ncbi:MAG: hypothetical protein NZ522_06630, partial [Chitinophagales bacterium]|nr:hypothetical protein [Chitinophagales bacterium]
LKQLKIIENKIKALSETTNSGTDYEEEITKLLKQKMLLIEQRKEFASILGNVIYNPAVI